MSKQNPLQYLLELLAKRDYSLAMLLQKISLKEYDQAEVTEAIKYLTAKNFINDLRIAENYIAFYYKTKGKNWIRQKCKVKGICESDFELAWEKYQQDLLHDHEIGDPEINQFLELKQKVMQKYKLANFANLEPKLKQKIYNYLIYRGFNPQELLENWKND